MPNTSTTKPWTLLRGLSLSALIASLAIGMLIFSVSAEPVVDEARINHLLSQLTLSEKVFMLSGSNSFATTGVERLGIHGMRFADGPNGVRSNNGDEATAFPTGIALASSWNPALAQQVGRAMGEETRAMGAQVLLGPNLNLVRSPLSGRNFETYGEDPLLAGVLGIGFVRGLQSVGVAASIKHYVGNEQETERGRGNSVIDARALHELYLKPFEMVVKDARPWTLMTAYNRTNGIYMSEHAPLIRDVLKQQWGFDGVVMSDWGGTHSTTAVNAGLDLEMPGPPLQFGYELQDAIRLYQVPESAVDAAARRILRLNARVGALDTALTAAAVVSTPAHREVARAVAAQAITLLKNQSNVLPLSSERPGTLAIIGPNADVAVIQGGGSAQVVPSHIVSPLDAIKTLLSRDTTMRYEQGVDNERFTPAIDGRDLSPTRARTERGLTARYYANARFAGTPVKTRVEQTIDTLLLGNDINLQASNNLSVSWQGYFWPRVTGDYEFEMEYLRVLNETSFTEPNAKGQAHVRLDGKLLLHPGVPPSDDRSSSFFPTEIRRARVHLTAGNAYPIRIDYAGAGYRVQHFRLAARLPRGTIAAAVEAARHADTALVFVGSGTTAEAEGRDRNSMALYGEQDALVSAVAAVNPHTIVVLNNGAPVAMPWIDQVSAVVEAWLPGQEGALALADVLFGKVNPSGKLPVSFPKRLQDSPSYLFYPGYRDAVYGESIFMGYRYYDKKEIEPLFPFGHGLSYTQFEYGELRYAAEVRNGEPLIVSIDIKNSGERAGTEVAQLYVSDPHCLEACPIRELKAFERVELQPGETRTVRFNLKGDAFAHYDAHAAAWVTQPGDYQLAVGSSSRDVRARGTVRLVAVDY